MSDHFTATYPTARKPHQCDMCYRTIRVGETYLRGAGMDGGTAWTWKHCEHCRRIALWVSAMTDHDEEFPSTWEIGELLEDAGLGHVYTLLRCGWVYPDGELVPPPDGSHCEKCRVQVEWGRLRCGPCDEARIERLNRQFAELSGGAS